MPEIELRVRRGKPLAGEPDRIDTYRVTVSPDDTVLEALFQIYDTADPSLAFDYSCRYKRCGLCSLMVNGRAVLACGTPARDGQLMEPLAKLPVVRDLVIDRSAALPRLQQVEAFIPEPENPAALPVVFREPPQRELLAACNDCLACIAHCPEFQNDGDFPGPLHFGKLAALSVHPQDRTDRREQARAHGLNRCLECSGCKCPTGVPVWKYGVKVLLGLEGFGDAI